MLRHDFVNTWLLAKDLEGIAAGSEDADVDELCGLIRQNYGYPVDSVLIAPDLSVVGHLNVHEPRAMDPDAYLAFLRRGLAAARGEVLAAEPAEAAMDGPEHGEVQPALRLTPAEPTTSVLDVVSRKGFGQMAMSFISIDAQAFPAGGTLELTVRLGVGQATGRFELCAAQEGNPQMMGPIKTIEQLGRGATKTLVHDFEAGAVFGLAAMAGGDCKEGDTNAFLATVTVRGR